MQTGSTNQSKIYNYKTGCKTNQFTKQSYSTHKQVINKW